MTGRKAPRFNANFFNGIEPPMAPPADALCILSANYYKIGLHGKVFRWNGDEWVRCLTITVEQVRKAKPLQRTNRYGRSV